MNELFAEVIDAHGGLNRWSSLNLGEATIVTGGGLWALKGDVAGGFAAAQIVHDYIEADGIRLPSKRRAYLRGPDHRPSLVLLVSIDISDVRFT